MIVLLVDAGKAGKVWNKCNWSRACDRHGLMTLLILWQEVKLCRVGCLQEKRMSAHVIVKGSMHALPGNIYSHLVTCDFCPSSCILLSKHRKRHRRHLDSFLYR